MRGGNNYGPRLRGQLGDVLKGDPGKSAYEIAVEHGYTGTESEWIAYVEANGDQAYQYTQEAATARDEAVAARSGAIGAKDAAAASAASAGGSAAQAQNAAISASQSAGNAGASEASAREYAQAASSYRNAAQAASSEAEAQALRCVERADEARDAQIRARESEQLVAEQYVEIMRVPETTREYARQAEASATAAGASALSASGSAEAASGSAEAAANSLTDINTGLASKLGKTETAVNAEKVNNLTVETAVPAGAVFTDTTYEAMTAEEVEAGSGTAGRVITAKVLSDYVVGAIAALVASSPSTLDTLKELADALGDDPNFATTMATALAGKLGKTETAVNAEKVNNLTVETAVPSGAVFTDTTYSNATTETAGLMSATDKAKLDGIASGAQVNTVTGVKGDGESSYRTGNVNITKGNIGLGNVDNTADSAKSVSHAATAGNADTVNNLTVQTAVPANAVFTDTTYSIFGASGSSAASGLVPAPASVAGAVKYLREDGTWTVPPDNNTTYVNFVGSGSGAAAGLVPAPSTTAGTTKYLREDGTWQVPPDTDTTYSNATTSTAGLMSAQDKTRLDGVPTTYATLTDLNNLASTATNSVSAAVAAQEAAEDARDEAQSIADGLSSLATIGVDTSLTITGQAADAKTVGDKFGVIGASSATNNEYVWVLLDSQSRVLLGVKADGSVAWQKGIPKPIKDELDAIKVRLTALEA